MFTEKRYPSWIKPERILNLKKQGSTLKGDIAEVIVKHKVNFAHRPREISPTFLDEIQNYTIPANMKKFLRENWYTVDIFTFVVKDNQVVGLELYEVKGRNRYDPAYKANNRKPQITRNAMAAYTEAIQLGFTVKYAEVIFLDHWDYYLFFKDFNPENFYMRDVEDPKYSKKKENASGVRIPNSIKK